MSTMNSMRDELVKIAASALRSRIRLAPYLHGGSMPGFEVMLGGDRVGSVVLKKGSKVGADVGAQVQGMELDPKFRGMGIGRKVYGELMRRTGTLSSDVSVSPSATSSWKKLLKNPSYEGTVNKGWNIPTDPKYSPQADFRSPPARGLGPFTASITPKARIAPTQEEAAVLAKGMA